jgi:hypothetical protein
MMRRKERKQELVAGAIGINNKKEFADMLHAVLKVANDGLNQLRVAAAVTEVDEIAEWSGLSSTNMSDEADRLRDTVQKLYTRAWQHYISLRESADRAPNEPPDIWCARRGQAAIKLNSGIVTCLENAPLGIGKKIAQQLRNKLDESGEEAILTEAAAMLLDAKTEGLLD